ncbi:membrane hypothetical protein [metagenome]|uniref:Branched-chain amino acid transport n=1 Tax=metagenome TaxID=256318 RepID=A0A2P2C3C3_9ZZZZ
MTVALAVGIVGVGSVLLRLLPLLGADLIPERLAVHAARAAIAVLAATTARTVLRHADDALTASALIAPTLAGLSVGLGLWLAYRGRSLLVASGLGLGCYLVLAAGFAAVG